MTVLALTLPLTRSSPIRIARRDLVTDGGDDLTLLVSVVADDSAEAGPVNLEPANTALQLLLWAAPTWRDYTMPYVAGRNALYTATASITDAAAGKATLTLPHDAGLLWPRRLGYTLRLDLGGSARATLSWGALHLLRVLA